jgi:heterodisulfide reductase subunit C
MNTDERQIKAAAPLRPGEHPAELCLGCGTCAAGCPMTGQTAGEVSFDPRLIVRLALLGRDGDLSGSPLPWLCTMCGRCEHACPMGINIVALVREARGRADRDASPQSIRKGVDMLLQTGNNLGLPDEDFQFILEDVAAELAEEPGFEEFALPLDATGVRLLCTLHNKLVNTQNEDLKHWWKIFHAAGEKWTIPARNWEGVNWGLFSGEDHVLKAGVDNIVANMERLDVRELLYPE